MSQENAEIVRAAHAATNRGDIDALTALCDPKVEFDWSERLLDPVIQHGHGGVRRAFEELKQLFEQFEVLEEELIDLGDTIVVVGQARFRGRSSGADVHARSANVWTIRGGKVVRFQLYQSKRDAFAALEAEGIS